MKALFLAMFSLAPVDTPLIGVEAIRFQLGAVAIKSKSTIEKERRPVLAISIPASEDSCRPTSEGQIEWPGQCLKRSVSQRSSGGLLITFKLAF
ncbi:MAG: hypothetical protein AAB618_03065 [Patescibacteria group bacterium]